LNTRPPRLSESDGGQVEQQNKELQNDEVLDSLFEISCSIFCGSK
jgi:hypothetical protein